MPITDIADGITPERPVAIRFGADTSAPSANQEVLLWGHSSSGGSSGSVAAYTAKLITNSGDADAAKTEAEGYFGVASELSKMVVAAINANAGRTIKPQIKCVMIPYAVADFGPSDAALTAANNVKAEFRVMPYTATDATLRNKLKAHCELVSGAGRVSNNQFGSIGVGANMSVTDPSTLTAADTMYLSLVTLRDSSGANPYSLGELAAAYASTLASNAAPFNPQDDAVISGVTAPSNPANWYSVGSSLESETVLAKGWVPLRVLPSEEVAIVRAVTTRISTTGTGTPLTNAYKDISDIQILFLWRKTLYTRFSQPDFKRKNSQKTLKATMSALLVLAQEFEEEEMFDNVNLYAKLFKVQRSATDRSTIEYLTPVGVVPNLHRMHGQVEASTQYDSVTF